MESSSSEDSGYFDPEDSEAEMVYIPTVKLYPPRAQTKFSIENYDSINVPMRTKNIFQESYESFGLGNYNLSMTGLRSVIESIHKDLGYCKQNGRFKDQIDKMIKDGIFTRSHQDILNKIRDLGNASIHELANISQEDLTISFEAVFHLIETIYILPLKKKNLKDYLNGREKNILEAINDPWLALDLFPAKRKEGSDSIEINGQYFKDEERHAILKSLNDKKLIKMERVKCLNGKESVYRLTEKGLRHL